MRFKYILFFLIISNLIQSQASFSPPYLFPSTVLPAPIYSTSPIKLVTKVSTTGWASRVNTSFTVTQSIYTVYLESCYGYGNTAGTSPRIFIDTFKIGTLNPGIYTAYFKPKISKTLYVCNLDTFNTTSFTFQVTDATPIDVSVSETNLQEAQIQVFPNPFDEELDLQLSGFVQYPIKLSITNSLGQMVYQELVLSNKLNLQTNYIAKGIYYLKIDDGVQTKRVKLIKN